MDDIEIRLRSVEAASRSPSAGTHKEGYAGGVLEAAGQWYMWIKGGKAPFLSPPPGSKPLGLPNKK